MLNVKTTVCSLVALLFFAGATLANDTTASGAALYNEHCASCHRPISRTLLIDRPAKRIRSAIDNLPAMVHLKTLSQADLQAIALALSNPTH